VNTKADIRFDVLGADFLPDWVKDNLMQQARCAVCVHKMVPRPSIIDTPPLRASYMHALPAQPRWVLAGASQEKNRMNNEGELVVNSSRHRTQK
jgi:hypothetical protein